MKLLFPQLIGGIGSPKPDFRTRNARARGPNPKFRLSLLQRTMLLTFMTLRHLALALILFSAIGAFAQQLRTLHGTVLDPSSLPISGAAIEYRTTSGTQSTTTDSKGEFLFSMVAVTGTLIVHHAGFEPITLPVTPASPTDALEIHMEPAPILERIQVSADEDREIPPTPTSEFVISTETINQSASLVLDDVLREVPGFTLFRRSDSLYANPTTQGVSLRGVGANGASRASVLLDGIPLNDPFGGWVYWNQAPSASIQSMDVINGAASDMYGGGALGGVVNLTSRPVNESFATAEISYGTENTAFLSFDAGTVIRGWGISFAGQSVRTSGYILVPTSQRGSIDTPAGTADLAGSLQLSHKLGEQGNFFLRWTDLAESRQNGTPDQTNNTRLPTVDLGADWTHSTAGSFSLRAYASDEVFNQNFSAVAANRDSEILTDVQRSPSYQVGAAAQWQRTFYARHTVTAGIEARDVHGHSFEITSNAAGPTADVDAGGTQRTIAYFAQDAYLFAPNWLLTFGGRVDTWLNRGGFANRFALPNGPLTANAFPNRSETAFSPRISLMHSFKHGINASASVYRAFRAPTLNEALSQFSSGQSRHRGESDAHRRNPDRRGSGPQHPEMARQAYRSRKFFLERHRKPRGECHALHHSHSDHTRARKSGSDSSSRRGNFGRIAPSKKLSPHRRIHPHGQHRDQLLRRARSRRIACAAGAQKSI